MKAIVYHQYGSPDVLKCEEIEKPMAGDDEVLIRLCAASVNPLDWHFMRGKPLPARLMMGALRRPKHKILGCDIAGRVEAVGRNVKQFQPGDEVFGAKSLGAFAEYVCVAEGRLVRKPASTSFEAAAAGPGGGRTSPSGLLVKGRDPGRPN